MRQRTYIMGVVFISLIFIGLTLRALHLPGAAVLIGSSTLLFILVFSTSFAIDKITLEKRRIAKISHVVLTLAMVLFLWGGLFVIMEYPGSKMFTIAGLITFCIYMVFLPGTLKGENY